MRKIFHVAARDFLAAVRTKGFIIAVLVPPTIYAMIIVVFPRLVNNRMPPVSGQVIVIDGTGQVLDGVRHYLDPQVIAERRNVSFNRVIEASPVGGVMSGRGGA